MNILYSAITLAMTLGLLAMGISLLPDAGTLPAGFSASIITIASYMKAYSFLLDFNTLFTVVSLVFTTEIAILGFKGLMWVMRAVTKSQS